MIRTVSGHSIPRFDEPITEDFLLISHGKSKFTNEGIKITSEIHIHIFLQDLNRIIRAEGT